jgi:hypothetical protein
VRLQYGLKLLLICAFTEVYFGVYRFMMALSSKHDRIVGYNDYRNLQHVEKHVLSDISHSRTEWTRWSLPSAAHNQITNNWNSALCRQRLICLCEIKRNVAVIWRSMTVESSGYSSKARIYDVSTRFYVGKWRNSCRTGRCTNATLCQ